MSAMLLSRRFCATAVLAAALLGGIAPAGAQKSSLSIVVMDIRSILRDSTAAKSIQPQIGDLRSSYQAAAREREETLRKAGQDLQRQRAILSADAFAKKRREYETRARAAQTEFQTRKRQLDGAYNVAMGKVQESILSIAAKIARERKLDLVLPKSLIILSAKELDITKEVLERVNNMLPSVKVTLPEAAPSGKAKTGR